jgi:hypothetical protein
MRESGMGFSLKTRLMIVARWAREVVAPKVQEMVYIDCELYRSETLGRSRTIGASTY